MDRLQWFIDRIGKRVYRNHHDCCEHCETVYKGGLIIADENHANYLYDIEVEFTADGEPTQYFDTREEMLQWESENKLLERSIKNTPAFIEKMNRVLKTIPLSGDEESARRV